MRPLSPRFADRQKQPFLRAAWKALRALFERPLDELNRAQRLLVNLVRFIRRTPHRILYDRCLFHAAALSYQSLLALVPILALALAILSNPAFEEGRTKFLDKVVDAIYPVDSQGWGLETSDRAALARLNRQGKTLVRDSISKFTAGAGGIGVAGLAGLLVVLVLQYRNIEISFNLLWGLEKHRKIPAQALRALGYLLLVPTAVWSSLLLKGLLGHLPFLEPGSNAFARFIWGTAYPYAVVSLALAFLYQYIPHTKVFPRASLGAGFLTGLALELGRHVFTFYVVRILHLSKVYGALGVVPLVMIWLYLSWAIVLFGAEMAHVIQHLDKPEERPGPSKVAAPR